MADKIKQRLEKKYDWMVWPGRDTLMDGVGTEMCLMPVLVDRETGLEALMLQGKRKGKKRLFTKNEWNTGKIQIAWMWPGHRIGTLLKLLRENRLAGRAAMDVTALKAAVDGTKLSGSSLHSKKWANDIIQQEGEKYEEQKLRARRRDGKVPAEKPVRARGDDSDSSSRKQEPGDDRQGRLDCGVRTKRNSTRTSKAKSRVDSKKRKRRAQKASGGN